MSTKPHPVAETAALLALRASRLRELPEAQRMSCPGLVHPGVGIEAVRHACASLASALHRLAKATTRQAEAECNGEPYPGARDRLAWLSSPGAYALASAELEAAIEKAGARLDRRIARLNERLWPLSVQASRSGDPHGFTLHLHSTDPARPLPGTSLGNEEAGWGIA